MSENEKDKEIKKTSETESYEDYEGEAIENFEEGSGQEEESTSKDQLPFDYIRSDSEDECSESKGQSDELSSTDTYEKRKRELLIEKWLTVTGKKPKNIPVLRKPFEEGSHRHVFFGDRKPEEMEKKIRRKLLAAASKVESRGLQYGKVLHEIHLPALFSALLCIRFDPTAEFMACSDRKGGVEIRNTKTGEVKLRLKTVEYSERLAVSSVRYSPVDPRKIYVVGQTGSVQVFTTKNPDWIACTEAFGSIYNMDINTHGQFLVTGGKEGKIYVIDPTNLQVISKKAWPGESSQPNVADEYHKMRVYGLRCHPTEVNVFATGGWDNTLKIWDVRVQGAIRSINGPAVYGDGLDLKGNIIMTASWRVDNSLNFWDFYSGKFIKNIPITSKSTKFEGEFLYTCRFFNDGPGGAVHSNLAAIGGSGFSDVIVINTKTNKIEQYFPSFKPTLCMDISGNLLAYGGTESIFRITEVNIKSNR